MAAACPKSLHPAMPTEQETGRHDRTLHGCSGAYVCLQGVRPLSSFHGSRDGAVAPSDVSDSDRGAYPDGGARGAPPGVGGTIHECEDEGMQSSRRPESQLSAGSTGGVAGSGRGMQVRRRSASGAAVSSCLHGFGAVPGWRLLRSGGSIAIVMACSMVLLPCCAAQARC